MRSTPSKEEGVAETCEELITTPIPRPPVPLVGGKEGEKSGVKLSLGRRRGVVGGGGEGVLRFGLISPYLTLI